MSYSNDGLKYVIKKTFLGFPQKVLYREINQGIQFWKLLQKFFNGILQRFLEELLKSSPRVPPGSPPGCPLKRPPGNPKQWSPKRSPGISNGKSSRGFAESPPEIPLDSLAGSPPVFQQECSPLIIKRVREEVLKTIFLDVLTNVLSITCFILS